MTPSSEASEPASDPGAPSSTVARRDAPAPPARLPFNVIDELIHTLDTEAAPWTVQLEARVSGRLDEDRLRAAVRRALSVHPLARARKRPARAVERVAEWQIPESIDLDPVRVVECHDDADLAAARAELQSLPLPLVESPPLRVRLVRHPGGDFVMLNVHHAASDGFGCLAILRSIARAYAGEREPPDERPHEVRALLEARDLRPLLGARDLATRVRRLLLLLEKAQDLGAVPARLAHRGGTNQPGYAFHTLLPPAAVTERLLGGRRGRSTVNDVLVAAMHVAIQRWNDAHGVRTGRIGVLVPVNLRPSAWSQHLVRNLSLPVRVSTRARDRASPRDALTAVTEQMRRIKDRDTAAALVEVLAGPASLPGWAKQALPALVWLSGERLVDTAMLSNVGRVEPPSFGDAGGTTELWFSPPARMPLGLTIGAATIDGRLHLAFRHRHRLFDSGGAAAFAACYVSALRDVVELIPSGAAPTRSGGGEVR